jgi:hypothetical protein
MRFVPGLFPFVSPLPAVLLVVLASSAASYEVSNYTGLPVFPSLSKASMDRTAKTDTLGRWCIRFSAETSYPLTQVETWYRKALRNASETDLTNDEHYKSYPKLVGIKLALGIDYVTVYRVASLPTTSIELFKCSVRKNGG